MKSWKATAKTNYYYKAGNQRRADLYAGRVENVL